jgi:hypothetical protein
MRKLYFLTLTLLMATLTSLGQTYYPLSGGSFTQNWTDIGLITANDTWPDALSIKGFRGDGLTSSTAVDPQSVLTDGSATPLDVNANQTNPNTNTTGGVTEFHISDPVVALQGSGTARAPHLVIYLNTIGTNNIQVQYKLRDIDGSADNAAQPVTLQYRVGNSGNFTNVPAAFVADAAAGPSLATQETVVNVMLPAVCEGKEKVELRILTTDAVGSDEWVGIDNIEISAGAAPSLTVSAASGVESSESGTAGTFVVTLSTTAPAGGVTVNYSFEGSATFGSDYSDPAAGSVLIAAGSSSATITLPVINDAVYEGQETITLNLTSASNGYVLVTTSATINLNDNETPPLATVVINQVYGGGGNAGALYKNDFIELYNYGNTPVSVEGWSVQYGSSSGTSWQVTKLTGSIPPHDFYLVQEGAGSGGTRNLPSPNAFGTILMAGGSGKIILSSSDVALSGANPTSSSIIDRVGYGGANGFETQPTLALSNTTSAIRNADGVDTDNNFADFTVADPMPRNTGYRTTAPTFQIVSPPDNHTDAPSSMTLVFDFDKPVQKGSGSITLFENGVSYASINVVSGVTLTGGFTASFPVSLNAGKTYSVQIAAGAFTDAYGNAFAGITDHTTWNFTTYNEAVAVILPASFAFQSCTTNGGLLAGGFTQYSATGSQVWDCTPYGRDPNAPNGTAEFPSGIQINGYDGETNVPNVDWLISPRLDLTGTTYPLLSFWSRTAFNGQPLQLKISTDYTGGNPEGATWTDLNGKFPTEGSNVWTLSEHINLSAFKGTNVHLAFVYTSSSEDGARWTLDDISLENSQTPPPPSLTVATTDLQFGYTASGKTSTRTFTFIGNDLTEDVTLTANGPFLLSKDGSGFASTIIYAAGDISDKEQTVTVQFAPTQQGQDFTGILMVSTSGITRAIDAKGTSINPAGTLEVVNWNVEWFGSPLQDPKNDDLQQQNVTTVFNNLKADIYALSEVVNEDRLRSVVASMPGYEYVLSDYGSHTNTSVNPPSALAEAQKLAFVYNTNVIKNLNARALLSKGINTSADLQNPYYRDWASGRFPFLMEAEVTLNCMTQKVNFVLVHAKANTSPTNTSYERRAAGAKALHDSLQLLFPNDNIVILGDFNDDLDASITAGKTTTSWSSFTTDGANYTTLTLPLSQAGKRSTVSHDNVIDHVVVSNEMEPYYMDQTATVRTDVTGMVSNYGNTTSDHYPVFTRYRFAEPVAPVVSVCPATQAFCVNSNGTYTIPAFEATASCGTVKYHYTITGATSRSGETNDASGAFNAGTNTITWTATDELDNTVSCQTTVTVNANPAVTINDAYALPSGTKVNTVYVGYSPASSLTLTAEGSGGTLGYTYSWQHGSTGASYTASPTAATTYVVTVTDANGCTATDEQLVSVVDVRAGRNRDKVLVCHQYDKKQSTLEVEQPDVASHLAHGDMLGSCESGTKPLAPRLTVGAQPNPSSGAFTLSFHGGNPALSIQLKVSDLAGRVIETRAALRTDGIYTLGSEYGRGIYLVEVMHGGQRQTLKLVKQ